MAVRQIVFLSALNFDIFSNPCIFFWKKEPTNGHQPFMQIPRSQLPLAG